MMFEYSQSNKSAYTFKQSQIKRGDQFHLSSQKWSNEAFHIIQMDYFTSFQ